MKIFYTVIEVVIDLPHFAQHLAACSLCKRARHSLGSHIRVLRSEASDRSSMQMITAYNHCIFHCRIVHFLLIRSSMNECEHEGCNIEISADYTAS